LPAHSQPPPAVEDFIYHGHRHFDATDDQAAFVLSVLVEKEYLYDVIVQERDELALFHPGVIISVEDDIKRHLRNSLKMYKADGDRHHIVAAEELVKTLLRALKIADETRDHEQFVKARAIVKELEDMVRDVQPLS